jgi:hypothetical protein
VDGPASNDLSDLVGSGVNGELGQLDLLEAALVIPVELEILGVALDSANEGLAGATSAGDGLDAVGLDPAKNWEEPPLRLFVNSVLESRPRLITSFVGK